MAVKNRPSHVGGYVEVGDVPLDQNEGSHDLATFGAHACQQLIDAHVGADVSASTYWLRRDPATSTRIETSLTDAAHMRFAFEVAVLVYSHGAFKDDYDVASSERVAG